MYLILSFLVDPLYSRLSNTAIVFKEHLTDMLHENTSLKTLGIYSIVEPLQFPAMEILNAAADHPRLRTIVFIPPTDFTPPKLDSSEPFQMWLGNNLSQLIGKEYYQSNDVL